MVKPLSVYIHIPFCKAKCHYCSFYTIPYKDDSAAIYTKALLEEWDKKKDTPDYPYRIVSLFFGGGTPSLLPIEYIEKIIRRIASKDTTEITIECNPEDLNPQTIRSLYACGVNRLSIGVQTFQKHILQTLGRSHRGLSIVEVILSSSEIIKNISVDLIYGLPNQTEERWKKDITIVCSLPILHASFYNLTIDPQTVFFKYRERILKRTENDEAQNNMAFYADTAFQTKGFRRYEIASYSIPGFESLHNLGYWNGRDFIGLGASAAQYLNGTRSQNINRFSKYVRGALSHSIPQIENERLNDWERQKELIAIHLRIIEGIPLNSINPELIQTILKSNILQSFLEIKNDRLKLNDTGLLFHDTVATEIMALSKKSLK